MSRRSILPSSETVVGRLANLRFRVDEVSRHDFRRNQCPLPIHRHAHQRIVRRLIADKFQQRLPGSGFQQTVAEFHHDRFGRRTVAGTFQRSNGPV